MAPSAPPATAESPGASAPASDGTGSYGATPAETAEASAEAVTPPAPVLLDQPDPAVALGVARAAATTGVPDGVVLTPMTGEIRVRTPGQVVDGIDLTGCLIIEASNVVVRNSRVSCRNPTKPSAVHVMPGNWNLLVEDSEIDGLDGADIGIGWNNYTLRRVEIRNVADGAKAGSNVTIEDSWIHDIIRKGDLHPDAIQSTGGRDIVIRRNYLDPVPMGATDVRNSAIQLGSENGDGLSNVLIENNILIGGNYTVNVRGDTVVQNVVFRGNVFNAPRRYGPIQAPPSVVFENNIDLVTGGAQTQVRLVYS